MAKHRDDDSSRKRKRSNVKDEETETRPAPGAAMVRIRCAQDLAGEAGPVVASFPFQPPSASTGFTLYGNPSDPTSPCVLAGETDRVEYETRAEPGCTTTYCLGLLSSSDATLTLYPAPFHPLGARVKALKHLPAISSSTAAAAQYQARATLGNAFGTKKARRAIRNAERSKIDPSTLGHVQEYLAHAIDANSAALPTDAEVKALADAARPIPPPALDAKEPKDVYSLSSIVPDAELKAIPMERILAAPTAKAAAALLPYRKSIWVNSRLRATWAAHPSGNLPKKEQKRLRSLVYVSYLLAARTCRTWNRENMKARLSPGPPKPPTQGESADPPAADGSADDEAGGCGVAPAATPCPDGIVDGLLRRFTETPQNSTRPVVTSTTRLKLLSYLAALCLIYDDCTCHLGSLAEDLQMEQRALAEVFKSLGCSVAKLSAAEVTQANARFGSIDVSKERVARLTVPVKFPEVRRKRRT